MEAKVQPKPCGLCSSSNPLVSADCVDHSPKYQEISHNINKNTDNYRNIGDIPKKSQKILSTDYQCGISCRASSISEILVIFRRNFPTFQTMLWRQKFQVDSFNSLLENSSKYHRVSPSDTR